jgi:hypothetical protein
LPQEWLYRQKEKVFYLLHSDLLYTEYTDYIMLDRNATNIGYKSTLETLKKTGNRSWRKQAYTQEVAFIVSLFWELFANTILPTCLYFQTRNNPTAEFGKIYQKYWQVRDAKANTAHNRTAQLQQIVTENTINLAQMVWGTIQKLTKIVR